MRQHINRQRHPCFIAMLKWLKMNTIDVSTIFTNFCLEAIQHELIFILPTRWRYSKYVFKRFCFSEPPPPPPTTLSTRSDYCLKNKWIAWCTLNLRTSLSLLKKTENLVKNCKYFANMENTFRNWMMVNYFSRNGRMLWQTWFINWEMVSYLYLIHVQRSTATN